MFASLKRNNLQRKTRQCESNLSYASTLSNEEEEEVVFDIWQSNTFIQFKMN